jgi:hypothetical protein
MLIFPKSGVATYPPVRLALPGRGTPPLEKRGDFLYFLPPHTLERITPHNRRKRLAAGRLC